MRVRCVSKNRNEKGVIVNYNLQDEKGNKFQATAQQIKNEIKAGRYQFTNLQIDKAGRLVDKAEAKVAEAKATKINSKRKIDEKEEKRNIARKEVRDYIKLLKDEYTCENDGLEKFMNDFSGEGTTERRKKEDGGYELVKVCRMSDITRNYFDMFIKLIEYEALKDKVTASRSDYTEFYAKVPESINKFMEASGCDVCILEALFYKAAENSKFALIRCGYEEMSDGFVGEMILTANYNKAKEFMIDMVEYEAENIDIAPIELLMKSNFVEADNMLGRVFITRLKAEIHGYDVESCKKKVLEMAKKRIGGGMNLIFSSDKEHVDAINSVLWVEEFGRAYLAFKLEILPPINDDWTEEDIKIKNKIREEAERLEPELWKQNKQ